MLDALRCFKSVRSMNGFTCGKDHEEPFPNDGLLSTYYKNEIRTRADVAAIRDALDMPRF